MADNYISRQMDKGTINISEEVISSLVKTAVFETEGVAEVANAAGAEIAEFIGIKNSSKGIKVRFEEQKIGIDAVVTVAYGNNIVEVAEKAQQAVINAVQTMTGFEEVTVNIHIAGIAF